MAWESSSGTAGKWWAMALLLRWRLDPVQPLFDTGYLASLEEAGMIRLRAPILGALLSVILLFVSVPHAQAAGFRSIDVNLSTQTARAIEGGQVVYTAGVTTGRPGWRTPTGRF